MPENNKENKEKYIDKLNRYTAAMENKKPDKVPIRPFAAEFTGKYYTNKNRTSQVV